MLAQLTQTLFQNRKLIIPQVGTFEVKQHPAVLEFAERLLHAPYSVILFHPNGKTTDANSVEKELQEFGSQLKSHLNHQSFNWPGIGALEKVNDVIVFHAEPQPGLPPVVANKVLRENREHAVLVGDTERSSTDTTYNQAVTEGKKSLLWIGWLLVVLALIFIGFLFYKKAIHPGASQYRISYNAGWHQLKEPAAESSSI